jgi:stearoyl-CoA desaturase (Delta-9 desaturase)
VPNANFYAADLLKDPYIMAVNGRYYWWVALGLAAPALAGAIVCGGWTGAVEGLIWGGLVRMCAGHHMIWWITSFAHVFGRRDYRVGDLSTNNWWLALPTLGESWHNNHHAFPHAPALDFKWWQFDVSGVVIRSLARFGLAHNLHAPSQQLLRARAGASPPGGTDHNDRRAESGSGTTGD